MSIACIIKNEGRNMEVPEAEYIEIFHLLFLDHLGKKMDKKLYTLKGGCNLRFFLKSIRYSQGLDLDIRIIGKLTLEKNVNQILKSLSFRQVLASKQIELQRISCPKQTETTQRWKIQLLVKKSLNLNTKIEFSRRGNKDTMLFGPIDSSVISHYAFVPILISHYDASSAFRQKVAALISRNCTQTRDVFDLYHLINSGVSPKLDLDQRRQISKAKENILNLSFADFRSQVVSFLPFEYHSIYDAPKVWDEMILCVMEVLNEKP